MSALDLRDGLCGLAMIVPLSAAVAAPAAYAATRRAAR
jgi:hypothetical protein